MFHQHEIDAISFEHANLCEKSIYFIDKGDHCGHEDHVSNAIKKCSLCEHQSCLLYTFEFLRLRFLNQKLRIQNFDFYQSCLANFVSLILNKGPPLI